jgi:regulator of sigma E protease
MDYVIYFAITIGILVFIHEFGHFAAAKSLGMRADIFAIGFGKRLFGWNKLSGFSFGDLPKDFDGQGNTDYRLCLLPLGGYVKIAGMIDESFDADFVDKEPQPYEFRVQPTWKKVIVICAGVFMNLLLALFIFWGNNFFHEKQIINTTTIGYVTPHGVANSLGFETNDKILTINNKPVNSWDQVTNAILVNDLGENLTFDVERHGQEKTILIPRKKVPDDKSAGLFIVPNGLKCRIGEVFNNTPAQKAGIKTGDIFVTLNHQPVSSAEQTTDIISSNKGNSLPLTVLRGKDTLNLTVTPGSDGKIGIGIESFYSGSVTKIKYGFFESFYYGCADIGRVTNLTFTMLGRIFSGKLAFGKAFAGPVRIAQMATTQAELGLSSFLVFLGLLSLSLAIVNIFPFPVLDGGHLVMILIEGVTKKEIPIKVKLAIQQVGFYILLLLMAFIIYSDIINL